MKHLITWSIFLSLATAQGQSFSGMDPSFGVDGFNAFDLTGTSVWPVAVQPRQDGGYLVTGTELILIASDNVGYYQTGYAHYGQRSYSYDGFNTFGQYFVRSTPLPNDGVLVIGATFQGSNVSNLVALDASGELDPSFSTDGVFSLTTGDGRPIFWDVLRLDDGRILASGGWSSASDRLVVIRLLANGSLDPSFGTGGIADYQVGETGGLLRIAADGKILCGRGGFNRGLVRLLDSGDLDPSFGTGGVLASYPFPFPDIIYDATDFAPQADGSIVILGEDRMRRLAPDQSADPDLLSTAFGGGVGLAVQPDGKILRLSSTAQMDRFLPSGAIDLTFNGIGSTMVGATGDIARGFILEEDGSMTTFGSDPLGLTFLARTSATGQPIDAFGEGGRAVFSGENGSENPTALAIRSDGAMTCAGQGLLGTASGNTAPCTYIAQFDATGNRDLSFSADGVQTRSFFNAQTSAYTSDNSLILYGQAAESFFTTPVMERYLADGTFDELFDLNTIVDLGVYDQLPYPLRSAGDLAVDPSDRIYVSAWRSPTPFEPTRAGIKCFDPDGTPNTGFAAGGEFIYDPGVDCGAFQLATFPNGDLLAAILVDDSVDYSYLYRNKLHLVRIAPDGSLVPTFGNAGVVETYIDGLTRHVTLTRLAILPDQRFVIGAAPDGDPNTFHVARFMADGQPDLSLGGDGAAAFDSISTNYGTNPKNLLVYPDGSMILVGPGYNGPGVYFQKMLVDGSPDLSFGDNGVFFINPPDYTLERVTAALTEDGQVIFGGLVNYACESGPPCYVLDHFLARLMPEFSVGWDQLSSGNASDMLVFPNPARESLNLELPATFIGSAVNYSVIDHAGRTVLSGTFSPKDISANNHRLQIPGPFSSGVYVLELRTGQEVRSAKVLFTH